MATRTGRDDELARALAAVYAVQAGQAELVLIEGEPGIGKTDLLEGMLPVAARSGFVMLRADADEAATGQPFGVLDQLLPGIRTATTIHAAAAEALREFDRLQGEGPVCVSIEDADSADPETLEVLDLLLSRVRLDPVLLVVTVRSSADGIGARLRLLLEAGAAGVRLELRGLTRDQLGTVLTDAGHPVPPAALTLLEERTGGNPLYALTVARAIGAAGAAGRLPDALPVPRKIADGVRRELAGRPAAVRTIIEAMALAASPLPVTTLVDVAADLGVVESLPKALNDPTLVEVDRGGARLRSALLREVARAGLDVEATRRLHLLLAQHLTGAARLRHLVLAAPAEGDADLAADLEEAAQDAVSRGDYAQGARHLLTAARVSVADLDRDRRACEAGYLVGIAEDLPLARQIAPSIIAQPPSPERDLLIAGLYFFNGQYAAADTATRALVGVAPRYTSAPVFALRVAVLLSSILTVAGREEAALEAVEHLPPIVPSGARILATDGVTDRMHRMRVVFALWANGRVSEALVVLDDMIAGDRETPEHAEALLARGRMRFYFGRTRGAQEDLAEGVRAARSLAVPAAVRRGLADQALIELYLGDWAAASARANQVIIRAQEDGDVRGIPTATVVAAMLAAGRGDQDSAAQHLAWLRQHVTPDVQQVYQLYAATAEMWVARSRGDQAAVLLAAERLDRTRVPAFADRIGLASWRALPVEALLDLGRLDEAEQALGEFAVRAYRLPGSPLVHGHPAWLTGRLAEARGEPDQAAEHYDTALRISHGLPHAHARVLLSLGRLLRRRGDHAGAQQRFAEAHAQLIGLGAFPEASAAAALLVEQVPPTRSRPEFSIALTARERDVAHVVSLGRTNREIAAELFLSLKTVEYHVSNIMTKLGVSSRRELWGSYLGR
jgi:DNA-binding CsgD family transcriptional regulator